MGTYVTYSEQVAKQILQQREAISSNPSPRNSEVMDSSPLEQTTSGDGHELLTNELSYRIPDKGASVLTLD